MVLACCLRQKYRRTKQYPVTENTLEATDALPSHVTRRRTPIYEELPCGPILGTEFDLDHPLLLRQCGIEHDTTLSKVDNNSYHGSNEPLCGSSDVSGLSGVSGNVPGAHKMPKYSAEGSFVSDTHLVPPQPWAKKNLSDSTFNTTHTQSTVLGSNSHLDPRRTRTCSNSELRFSHSPVHRVDGRLSASQGYINSTSEPLCPEKLLYATDVGHPYGGYYYPDGPHPFNNSPLHASMSHASSNSSVRKQDISSASSRRSSTQHNQQPISFEVLLTVVDLLQHNKNCEVPGCCCQQVKQMEAVTKRAKSHERKMRKSSAAITSSSTESDSDSPDNNNKKKKLHLELGTGLDQQLYPHYHLSSKSHIRRTQQSQQSGSRNKHGHNRSRSMTDLTPITETGETPTPTVGGPILPGTPICPPKSLGIDGNINVSYKAPTRQELLHSTARTSLAKPRPPLLRQKSISTDNIPVLCLNDCLAKLATPSPSKPYSLSLQLNKNNPGGHVLKTVRETSNSSETDGSNTSSRSRSPPMPEAVKLSQSDTEEVVEDSLNTCSSSIHPRTSVGRVESSGYESVDGDNSSAGSVFTAASNRRMVKPQISQMSPVPTRSPSPFETKTEVSSDGCKIQTTEC